MREIHQPKDNKQALETLFQVSLFWGLALSGCQLDVTDSNSIKADKIYQNYTLKYNEKTKETCGVATFNIGSATGNSVDLQSPSNVSFNGRTMEKKAILGLFYQTCRSGEIAGLQTWVFSDQDGKNFTNSAQLYPFSVVNIPPTISRASGGYLNIAGSPIMNSDRFSAWISAQGENGTTRVLICDLVVQGARLVVSPKCFEGLRDSLATVTMKRTSSFEPQQLGLAGGSVQVSYEAADFDIRLLN